MEGYALITGASRGFGKALAFELASRKINLILVSLPGEGLDTCCQELKDYGIRTHYFETDLSQKENIVAMTQWVNQQFDVFILINNVGMGGTMEFTNSSVNYFDNLVQINIRTTVLITHQLLPNLRKQPRAYILNVSSIASFSPIGYKTVYAAAKQFVYYFTVGLSHELQKSNVRVSVVHPGPMKTNDEISLRIEKHGRLLKNGLITPEKMARITIRKMFRGRRNIIVGWLNKLSWLALKIVPGPIRIPIITRAVKREIDAGTKHPELEI